MARKHFIYFVEGKGFGVHRRAKDEWGCQHFTIVDDNGGECYTYKEALILADLYDDEWMVKAGWVRPTLEVREKTLAALRAIDSRFKNVI
jgi:hypothetical protein